MNPFLTASLRAERELQAKIDQQQLEAIQKELAAAQPLIAKAIDLIHERNLARGYSELYSDIADMHFSCAEALEKLAEQLQTDS